MLVNGPIYSLSIKGASITAALSLGDLLEVRSPADCILVPKRAWVTNEDTEVSEQIAIEFGYFVTAGTGGTSRTPEKGNEHLQASQTTCLERNTTDASGTEKNWSRMGANILGAGWEWQREGDLIVPISRSLVLGFASALGQTTVVSAGIEWMELGQ